MFGPERFEEDYNGLAHNRKATVSFGEDTFQFIRPPSVKATHAIGRFWNWLARKPDVIMTTTKHETVDMLKTFGISRGNTPTSVAYAFVGDYLRNILQKSAVSSFSKMTLEKVAIAKKLQESLGFLEKKELYIMPDDFQGHEKLRNAILAKIDKALIDNDALSYGVFHSEGDLSGSLNKARKNIESYRFPTSSFSRRDQARPLLHEGEKFFYRASEHKMSPEKLRKFFVSLYHHKKNKISRKTNNPVSRRWYQFGQIFGIKNFSFSLEGELAALNSTFKKYSSNGLARLSRGIFSVLVFVPLSVWDAGKSLSQHVKKERKEWLYTHTNCPPAPEEEKGLFENLKKSLEGKIHQASLYDSPPSDLVLKKILANEENKQRFSSLYPKESPEILEHNDMFSQALRPLAQLSIAGQQDIIENPILYAALISMGITPAAGFVIPYELSFLITNHNKSPIVKKLFMQVMKFQPHTVQKTLSLMRSSAAIVYICEMCKSTSAANFIEDLESKLDDPFEMINSAITFSYLGSAAHLKMSSRDIFRFRSTLDDIALQSNTAQNIHVLSSKANRFLPAVGRFVLEFFITPVRFIAALGLAISNKTTAPIREEAKRFSKKLFTSLHALMDLTVELGRHAWNLNILGPKFSLILTGNLLSKSIGTVGDIMKNIGDLLLYPWRHAPKNLKVLMLPLAIPGAIAYGIGEAGKEISQSINWIKRNILAAFEKHINRPVQSNVFNALINYLSKNFNPRHPRAKLNEQIKKISRMEDLIITKAVTEEQKNQVKPELSLMKNMKHALVAYRKIISGKYNSFDNPEIVEILRKNIKAATSAYTNLLSNLEAAPQRDEISEQDNVFRKNLKKSVIHQQKLDIEQRKALAHRPKALKDANQVLESIGMRAEKKSSTHTPHNPFSDPSLPF